MQIEEPSVLIKESFMLEGVLNIFTFKWLEWPKSLGPLKALVYFLGRM